MLSQLVHCSLSFRGPPIFVSAGGYSDLGPVEVFVVPALEVLEEGIRTLYVLVRKHRYSLGRLAAEPPVAPVC